MYRQQSKKNNSQKRFRRMCHQVHRKTSQHGKIGTEYVDDCGVTLRSVIRQALILKYFLRSLDLKVPPRYCTLDEMRTIHLIRK